MKGILMLFKDDAQQQSFAQDTESFYNPKITKVEVTIEGVPNQLYAQGMRAYQQWDEAKKQFSSGPRRPSALAGVLSKELELGNGPV